VRHSKLSAGNDAMGLKRPNAVIDIESALPSEADISLRCVR
jgi:hypothetical protein